MNDQIKTKQVNEAHISPSELNNGLDCPNCPNQGWYADYDSHTGQEAPIQCEFCYTEPYSKFNLTQSNVK
jgi:hypothetical protein